MAWFEIGTTCISDEELTQLARDLVDSCSDGDKHTVAAAAVTSDGWVVTGMNLFHFTGGPCAEMTVMAVVAERPAERLDRIVAVGDRGRGVLAPCGRCRQILCDLHPQVAVLVPAGGSTRRATPGELLPGSYVWADQ